MSYDKEAVRAANPLETVVATLTGGALTRRGHELTTVCPFHDDHAPSLNINPEKGTYLCRSCHAGGDVFEFVQQFRRCTFPEAVRLLAEQSAVARMPRETVPRKPSAEARPSRLRGDQIEREHLYRDGLLRKVLLRERDEDDKKIMRWEHRASHHDPWCEGAGGRKPGLYRFAEACARLTGHRQLLIAEGERDADALLALGWPATTLPHGAGSQWLPEYAAVILAAGIKEVLALGDADDSGATYDTTIGAGLLSSGVCVRAVKWPLESPKGFDVSDVVARDGERAHATLRALLQAAPVYAPPSLVPGPSAAGWPTPESIDGELPSVEPFSLDLLPVSFRPLVGDITERMQVPMDYAAVAIGLCLAGVVNRRVTMQPKAHDTGWVIVPNLWGGIVAPPGFMKSPVIQAATRPLTQMQGEWRTAYDEALSDHARAKEEHELRVSAWKEQFKTQAKKGGAAPERPGEEPMPPTVRRLIVNDATFEALHQTMSENPAGILVIRDELTGWLSGLDQAGREQERAFCLQAWNGDTSHTIDRIGRGTIHVAACCMSMVGGIQPGRLRSYLVDALHDGPSNDGLIQRFQLLVWPDHPLGWRYVDRAPNAAAEEQAARIFRRLVELDAEHQARFTFAADAQALFVEWLEDLEVRIRADDLHPALVSHLAKYRSLMPALALLFELADRASGEGFDASMLASVRTDVSVEHAKQAAAWCDYLESHARRMYSCIVTPQRRAAQELAQKVKGRKLEPIFSLRDVYLKGWSGLETPDVVKSAAEVLQDAGWLRDVSPEPGPLGGRRSNRYEVNPMVWA
jgi:putative DNA primase/helicase